MYFRRIFFISKINNGVEQLEEHVSLFHVCDLETIAALEENKYQKFSNQEPKTNIHFYSDNAYEMITVIGDMDLIRKQIQEIIKKE
jgi:hypothetical protein